MACWERLAGIPDEEPGAERQSALLTGAALVGWWVLPALVVICVAAADIADPRLGLPAVVVARSPGSMSASSDQARLTALHEAATQAERDNDEE